MKTPTSLFLALLLLLFISINYSFAGENTKRGKMFVNSSLFTSKYSFGLDDVMDELPASFGDFLPDIRNEDDEDVINSSIAIGYYWSEHLSLRANYIDGIEIDERDFCIFFCPPGRNEFDGDMSIIEFDAKYRFVDLNPDLSLYVLAGVAYHRLNATVIDGNLSVDEDRVLLQKNITELNTKFGVGVQWDFLNNFGASLGYTHYAFASIDKVYLELEYRW